MLSYNYYNAFPLWELRQDKSFGNHDIQPGDLLAVCWNAMDLWTGIALADIYMDPLKFNDALGKGLACAKLSHTSSDNMGMHIHYYRKYDTEHIGGAGGRLLLSTPEVLGGGDIDVGGNPQRPDRLSMFHWDWSPHEMTASEIFSKYPLARHPIIRPMASNIVAGTPVTPKTDVICKSCKVRNPYATANQSDGSYLCFECRV